MQFTAAWVRRKRFEAGLLAQALLIGGMGAQRTNPAPVGRDAFWDLLTEAAGEVVEVKAAGATAGDGD